MTTLNEAREAIYGLFVTGWADRTAYTFDNERFDPPNDAPWVRLTVRHTGSTQETLGPPGSRKFARTGSCFVQVFVPIDQGVAEADGLATVAREVFEGVSIAGTRLRFLDVVMRESGPEKKWFGVVIEAGFEYDETR